jgi:hypothetical protein
MLISAERELRRSSPFRTPNSARGVINFQLWKWRSGESLLRLAENPPPQRNLGLKHTRMDVVFKKFYVKTIFKLKINVIQKYFAPQICLKNHQ